MTKKYQEKSHAKLLGLMGFEDRVSDLEGADELDIVYSGLEEIMTNAARHNWDIAMENNLSFRNACFVNAIKKVHTNIQETGMMI